MCNCKCKCNSNSEDNYIESYLNHLRKQRSGEVSGFEYKSIEEVFNFLKKQISKSDLDYCKPTLRQIGVKVYGRERPGINLVWMNLRDLEFLGNISIGGKLGKRTFKILKRLEF